MRRSAGIVRVGLAMLAGPVLWAAHFTLAYAGHAALCAAGDRLPVAGGAALTWLLVLSTGAPAIGLAALALSRHLARGLIGPARGDDEAAFLVRVTRLLAALSLFAVAGSAMAIAIVPACQSFR